MHRVDVLLPLLGDIDLALVMSVNPGWSAQTYMAEVEGKVGALRRLIDERSLATELEMDGGINEETAPRASSAGANVLVAGSAVFGRSAPVAERIVAIRRAARPVES